MAGINCMEELLLLYRRNLEGINLEEIKRNFIYKMVEFKMPEESICIFHLFFFEKGKED
jgi:hypothetical protein